MGNFEHFFSHYPALPAPAAVRLTVLPEHDCAYLPGRSAQMRAIIVKKMSGEMYHRFMDAGFRRSGDLLYQPICGGCRACVPIRLRVDRFKPNKSQRRCWRRNADLSVSWTTPVVSEEKFELYCRYIKHRHGGHVEGREEFERFLYASPIETIEHSYRDGTGRLLAAGICDVSPQSLSSVYFYFDPSHSRRSLGTYGLLREIEYARSAAIEFHYLGYSVRGCKSMEYKHTIVPNEILMSDGLWREPTWDDTM